jgi:glycosyltransferase involved in cell wall biosynthesis
LSRIEVIGNPVLDANLCAKSPRTRTSTNEGEVVMIGRLHSRKRTDVFVEAARMASDRGLPWRFTLIGPDEGELDGLLESIDSLPNLAYEGVLRGDQVAARLQQADLFALCSDAEPWGNVLVQAIVEGIPVVVTESAHLAGMILDYGAGTVVPDASPEAVCVAVDALLMNSTTYRDCSAHAIQLADAELSDAAVGNALLHLYSSARGNSHSVVREAGLT